MKPVRRTATVVGVVAAVAAVTGGVAWWDAVGPTRDCSKPIASRVAIDYGAGAGSATPEEALAKWLPFDSSRDLLEGHRLQPSDFTIRVRDDNTRDAVALKAKVGAVIERTDGRWLVTGAGPCTNA